MHVYTEANGFGHQHTDMHRQVISHMALIIVLVMARQADRQTATTGRQAAIQIERQTDRQTDRHNRRMDKQTNEETDLHKTDEQTDAWTDRQM